MMLRKKLVSKSMGSSRKDYLSINDTSTVLSSGSQAEAVCCCLLSSIHNHTFGNTVTESQLETVQDFIEFGSRICVIKGIGVVVESSDCINQVTGTAHDCLGL